ncbi:M48 family metallopeptidase [Dehalococcoidales bacterium]|nr:M48 family metallopeptidase [Dehalococcoidales bacterium]
MRKVIIFGKPTTVIEEKADHNSVDLKNGQIVVNSCKESTISLLREFLTELLYSQLCQIYDRVKRENKFELFGNLDFEIVESIDGKKQRVAKLKGNKILVSLKALALPKSALKYIVVHELAHIQTKRHGAKFWKALETIYPTYKRGEQCLIKHKDFYKTPLWLEEVRDCKVSESGIETRR